MRTLIAVLIVTAPLAPQRPYLSCTDGHIVESYAECPPVSTHRTDQYPPVGGGPRRSGLLGLGIGGIL